MKRFSIITLCAAMAVASSPAHAQFDFSSLAAQPAAPTNSTPAWQQFKLNPAVRVKLDFRNATVDSITHVLSEASGITIIKDPALVGGITLQSPTQQNLKDAFSMFNAVLGLKNYELTKQDNFLVIKAKQGDNGFNSQNMANMANMFNNSGGMSGRGGSRSSEVKVYQIKYASATALAKVINDLYSTTTGNNNVDLATLAQGLQGAAAGGRGGRNGQQGGPPNFQALAQAAQAGNNGGGGFGGRGNNNTPLVKASADDYSNALIINAPSSQQDQIADIIDKIDKSTDQPQQSRVFKLQYVLASDLQGIVQNILTNTVPLGRAASAAKTTTNQPRNPFFGGQASTSTTAGAVAADTKSNSLVVTTTPDILEHVAQVIAQLDKQPLYQSTTFVYTMKNARADVVANLLNQSFGNRTSNGPTGGSLSGATTVSSSSSSASAGSRPASLSATTTNQRNQNSQGVTSSTTTTVATTGLDANGRVVNIRNLTGQVLLVPNIDTNSIICVAPPEDRALVEQILAEMDQVPEQVMIETLVVEASLDKTDKLGVEWMQNGGTLFGGSNTSVTGGTSFGLKADPSQPQGLRYTINAGQYSVFLQALHSDKRFNVLSTPRIFTTNNAPAQINISQSLPYVTSQTVDTNGSTLVNYAYLDVGIVLTVTPRITSNGYVTMDVSQTANDFVGYTSFNAPIVNQREAQTTASVKDGETIVLGGIINNTLTATKNKVPVLGDLPVLGSLFRSNNTVNSKTELLVFMTPHVVRDSDEARQLREKTEAQLGRTTQQMIPQSATVANPAPAPRPVAAAASPSTPIVIPKATVTVTASPVVTPVPAQSTTTVAPATVTITPTPSDVQMPPPAPTTPPQAPVVPGQ